MSPKMYMYVIGKIKVCYMYLKFNEEMYMYNCRQFQSIKKLTYDKQMYWPWTCLINLVSQKSVLVCYICNDSHLCISDLFISFTFVHCKQFEYFTNTPNLYFIIMITAKILLHIYSIYRYMYIHVQYTFILCACNCICS